MTRRSWVQINGKLIPKDESYEAASPNAPAVLGDLPDFVSSIDGSLVRGRAGLRDHCARHDVVPTTDLKGLPPKPAFNDAPPSEKYRQETRNTIAEIINSRNYFRT